MTESNTTSELGQNGRKKAQRPLRTREPGATRYLVQPETPRERMLRVIKTVQKKQ